MVSPVVPSPICDRVLTTSSRCRRMAQKAGALHGVGILHVFRPFTDVPWVFTLFFVDPGVPGRLCYSYIVCHMLVAKSPLTTERVPAVRAQSTSQELGARYHSGIVLLQ